MLSAARLEVEKEVICEPLYDSAPNLSAAEARDGGASDLRQVPFASNRIGKRRREIGTDELKTSIDNLNKLFATSMSQQESKLADVMSVVNEIRQQNADIRMSVDFLSEEYNDLKKKLIAMDIERKDQILYIKSLEDKVESMERNSRSTGLELRNFTQKAGENESDLSELVMKIGEKLQTPVEQLEIKDVFRTKSKAENKPIIVEFTSVIKKEAILESLKKFKRDRKGLLESSSFGIHGLSTRVFISETKIRECLRWPAKSQRQILISSAGLYMDTCTYARGMASRLSVLLPMTTWTA
ncbi:Uncharacterized protein OBRU01_01339 [Operophtera brumata]|uniref:Zinc finger DNA binding protein n=1 Tax=Operophtera brumata TaxID=104452 RepID=A0A0L7LTP8_OPEBR|nr:Uncharacterized protein OBRU01_01339 [Operophtera brumata]